MQKMWLLTGTFLMFFLGAPLVNSTETADILGGVRSASGSFEQIIREQDGYVVDRQTGVFAMQRPRLFRWQISELDQLLISDGQQLYLYDELFEQVIVRDWSSNPAVNPAAILLDDLYLEEWARVERDGQNYVLTPVEDFGSILELRLTMNNDFPEMLSILDATGQLTEISFTQVELGIEHETGVFDFEMPLGVEVLYE